MQSLICTRMLQAAIALAAIACANATAQSLDEAPKALEPEQEMLDRMTFDQLDANDDGYVELAELPAGHRLINAFPDADRNDDGRIDRDEFGQEA